jgi:hypothetical protein
MQKNENSYGSRFSKDSLLPRLMWVSKQTNLKQLHLQVFSYFKHVFGEWIDWKDPKTTKQSKPKDEIDLKQILIKFPYRAEKPFTREEFMKMPDEVAFEMLFPGLKEDH